MPDWQYQNGPAIDFDSVANDGQFIIGALPLNVPPGSQHEFAESVAMSDVTNNTQQEQHQQHEQQTQETAVELAEKPIQSAIIAAAPMLIEQVIHEPIQQEKPVAVALAVAVESKQASFKQPQIAVNLKKRKPTAKASDLARELRAVLDAHSRKMDLTLPLTDIAGLPVSFSKAESGELCLGKYTMSARKLRLQRFKQKFAGRARPVGPSRRSKKKKPMYASRSMFAKSRGRVGGRFVKAGSTQEKDK
jgi:flagellar biosynthesis GTPase FlhF